MSDTVDRKVRRGGAGGSARITEGERDSPSCVSPADERIQAAGLTEQEEGAGARAGGGGQSNTRSFDEFM